MAVVNKTKKQVKYKEQAIVAINTNSNFRHMNKNVLKNVNFLMKESEIKFVETSQNSKFDNTL
jgi:hypothetical protein